MKKTMLIALIAITTSAVFAQRPGEDVGLNKAPAKSTTDTNANVKHRVVFQVTSNDTLVWNGLMKNIRNLKEGWGKTVEIEVVAHSAGIEMLMTAKTTQQIRIAAFKSMGVVFVGCENSMRERKISKAEIIPEAGFVPMGVGEIIMKQEQGWSYLKTGG